MYYQRWIYDEVLARLSQPLAHMQVLLGPRQVGKTTLAKQIMKALTIPSYYLTADEPGLRDGAWLRQQWQTASTTMQQQGSLSGLLVIDEVQKIKDWSSWVKLLWDETRDKNQDLRVLMLGSAPLLSQQGLRESLAGRFEVSRVTHWSYEEMQQAFDMTLDEYIYFGGYPGAAAFINQEQRWRSYINDALIETTIGRDILLLNRIDKPALLRQLFQLACQYSGQIVSYQKLIGLLHDLGNTTTAAHYLELLTGAGMVTGIHKYAGQLIRQRASSPKLQVFNTALQSAQSSFSFEQAKQPEIWGRWVESAIGAHLLNQVQGTDTKLMYWRERDEEVDFIIERDKQLLAIEVKSGLIKARYKGLSAFAQRYTSAKLGLVGEGGMPIEMFLRTRFDDWFKS